MARSHILCRQADLTSRECKGMLHSTAIEKHGEAAASYTPGTVHWCYFLAFWHSPLHEHINLHGLPSRHCLASNHIKVNFNVWVAVADTGNICQLWIAHLQQLPPFILLCKTHNAACQQQSDACVTATVR